MCMQCTEGQDRVRRLRFGPSKGSKQGDRLVVWIGRKQVWVNPAAAAESGAGGGGGGATVRGHYGGLCDVHRAHRCKAWPAGLLTVSVGAKPNGTAKHDFGNDCWRRLLCVMAPPRTHTPTTGPWAPHIVCGGEPPEDITVLRQTSCGASPAPAWEGCMRPNPPGAGSREEGGGGVVAPPPPRRNSGVSHVCTGRRQHKAQKLQVAPPPPQNAEFRKPPPPCPRTVGRTRRRPCLKVSVLWRSRG